VRLARDGQDVAAGARGAGRHGETAEHPGKEYEKNNVPPSLDSLRTTSYISLTMACP
jgi:hypothetical protein